MKLWIGGEICADIADEYRHAQNAVEDAINAVIEGKDYDLELDGWDCIAIIRDDEVFGEITRYSPKRRNMDFRLGIGHTQFKSATPAQREAMIMQMLIRSLALLGEKKGISKEGVENLAADARSIAKQRSWL